MFRVACRRGSSRFADVVVGAGDIVGSGACVVIDDAVDVQLLDFVFWFYEMFAQRAAGAY